MENKNNKYSIIGLRKFIITLVAFALIMLTGVYMETAAVSPVIWGLVSALGLFLTGSVVKGLKNKPHYENEDRYPIEERDY